MPDGYFADLEKRLKLSSAKTRVHGRTAVVHLAAAFALAALLVAALLFSGRHSYDGDDFSDSDRYVYADIIPHTDPFLMDLSSEEYFFPESDFSY